MTGECAAFGRCSLFFFSVSSSCPRWIAFLVETKAPLPSWPVPAVESKLLAALRPCPLSAKPHWFHACAEAQVGTVKKR